MFAELIHPSSTQNPPPAAQPPVPASFQDPAYSLMQKDMPFLNALHTLLTTGASGGVNWGEASASSAAGADFVRQMLEEALAAFAHVASSYEPSQILNKVLTTCVGIAATVASNAKSSKLLPADSAEVKDWQQRFQSRPQVYVLPEWTSFRGAH